MRRWSWLSLLAVALLAAAPVRAGTPWPQPAAGDSASGDPEIIFTFDDGPHELYTAPILDTLARYDIKALFFWTGWRVRGHGKPRHQIRRAMVGRAVAEGHYVGNHTITHARLCSGPAEAAIAEIDGNVALYEPLTRMPLLFFRAPYGNRCDRLEAALAERGLQHLHWDMDPLEWLNYQTMEIREYLIDRIGRLPDGRRAVILLHDTKYGTSKALPQVLDWLLAENARRRAVGRREIRILSYADLARERIPAAVQTSVDEAGRFVTGLVPDAVATLLAPLAPAPTVISRQ